MRITLVMDPLIPVPPRHYGGIERVIHDIAQEYARRGHLVTLLAGPKSISPGRLIVFGAAGARSRLSRLRNFFDLAPALRKESGRSDVVHNFGRLAYLLALLGKETPKVQTYMRPVTARNIAKFVKLFPDRLKFTGVSEFISRGGRIGGGEWCTVYNCADASKYTLNHKVNAETADLVFLARLERCKGLHSAIDVAKAANRRLTIAGNLSDLAPERRYFEQEIRPKIDGQQIRFIGPVDDTQKEQLLRCAAALLLPVEWDEPFPVVLPEALLCGTPVIGFRRGGIPEGIKHGVTGFVCDTVDEMIGFTKKLSEIDRAGCRQEALEKYSVTAVADDYLAMYADLQCR